MAATVLKSPGSGILLGGTLEAMQSEPSEGNKAAAYLASTVITGIVAYSSISGIAVGGFVAFGAALSIAAVPVGALVAVISLSGGLKPEEFEKATDVIGFTTSLGGLLGLSTMVVAGSDYQHALSISKKLGYIERVAGVVTSKPSSEFTDAFAFGSLIIEVTNRGLPKPSGGDIEREDGPGRSLDKKLNDRSMERRLERPEPKMDHSPEPQEKQRPESKAGGTTRNEPRSTKPEVRPKPGTGEMPDRRPGAREKLP